MKVGIITRIGKNYGAMLQAYALKKKCDDLGTEAAVINFISSKGRKSYHVCREAWCRGGILSNLVSLLHCRARKNASTRFLEFKKTYLNPLGDYMRDDEINAAPPECDICISGSDQVWNPRNSFEGAYYCSFAKNRSYKKIASYAASIGLTQIPDQYKAEFAQRMHNFDFISVREEQGKQILTEMGIPCVTAPDPTFLLTAEQWNDMAIPTLQGPYILCYFVAYPKGIKGLVSKIQKQLGYKVVNLMHGEDSLEIGDIHVRDAGPQQFLGLFKNASFVITSSFHGTVFSVLFQKPFLSTVYASTGSRVTGLLQQLGLENRIADISKYDLKDDFCDGIYTETVMKKIEDLRNEGTEILSEILEVK